MTSTTRRVATRTASEEMRNRDGLGSSLTNGTELLRRQLEPSIVNAAGSESDATYRNENGQRNGEGLGRDHLTETIFLESLANSTELRFRQHQLATVNAADQASPLHPADTVCIQIWRLQQFSAMNTPQGYLQGQTRALRNAVKLICLC